MLALTYTRSINMPAQRYEIGLLVDGVETIAEIDDTYPTVYNWDTAVEFAIRLAKHSYPDIEVELLFSKQWNIEGLEGVDFIFDTPTILQ
jgi:hypothetical protein